MRKSMILRSLLAITFVIGLLFAVTAVAAEQTFSGVVDENEEGAFILSADDGEDYIITGSGLASMVGKTVNITGTLAEGAEPQTINVMKIEEVEE